MVLMEALEEEEEEVHLTMRLVKIMTSERKIKSHQMVLTVVLVEEEEEEGEVHL